MLLEISGEITPERMKRWQQKQKQHPVVDMTNDGSKIQCITFLPRRKGLLISWLQSPSAVILKPPKIKSDTVSPSISHEVMGPDAMIFVF